MLNVGTGIARKTTSGNDGSYLFDLVQVGKYKVTVEKSGFTTFVREGVSLELNQNGRLDVSSESRTSYRSRGSDMAT